MSDWLRFIGIFVAAYVVTGMVRRCVARSRHRRQGQERGEVWLTDRGWTVVAVLVLVVFLLVLAVMGGLER